MTGPSRVMSPGFRSRVFDIVRQIPRGKVSTYGRIAALLGHPGVARHVGNALAACGAEELPVPWHRVVNASGKLSTTGPSQQALLAAEGVRFSAGGAIRLADFLWTPPPSASTAKPKPASRHKSKSKAKRSKQAAEH